MVNTTTQSLFIKACYKQPVDRTPVWIMRQAGRYLPEYRALRSEYSFLTLCKTPELAATVSLQPVERLSVDACILFSDILFVPETLGLKLHIDENKGGPQFENPIRTIDNIQKLTPPESLESLDFVFKTIALLKQRLPSHIPLIGFSGAPWTLAVYMIEGKNSKTFSHPKQLLYSDPLSMKKLLSVLTAVVTDYLAQQILSGADAVQLFDTWGGLLPPDEFREFSLAPLQQIVQSLRKYNVPIIVFCKDCGHSLEDIASTGCTVVGLDWSTDIGKARRKIGHIVALQGNLDPSVLYAPPKTIKKYVQKILSAYGYGSGHIFNLGHGILPDVPVEHVQALIEYVKEESEQFHR